MLVGDAVSADPEKSKIAIAALRLQGPGGLDALFQAHADEIATVLTSPDAPHNDSADWQRLCTALDAVAQQRDDFASHLYWYTDLDAAKRAAKESGKPILSLHLLGKLDEELSCANSRLFRTVLYANAEVSQYLRTHYILHWQSERPAPKVTIDFGDGRKLERTITGNSIHYILDDEGEVIDAVPGLYGPKAFLNVLQAAVNVSRRLKDRSPEDRTTTLRDFHRRQFALAMDQWNRDLVKIGAAAPVPVRQMPSGKAVAADADRRTFGKSAMERPVVVAVTKAWPGSARSMEEVGWESLAGIHFEEATLDQSSRAFMKWKNPPSLDPREQALIIMAKERPMSAFDITVNNLCQSIAMDTVRNEYLFHATIHQWLAAKTASTHLSELNDRIYTELFLTPASDPWLGLKPAHTYTALDHDGVTLPEGRQAAK